MANATKLPYSRGHPSQARLFTTTTMDQTSPYQPQFSSSMARELLTSHTGCGSSRGGRPVPGPAASTVSQAA